MTNRRFPRQTTATFLALFLFTAPASTNYRLEDWVIGGGGNSRIESTNYAINPVLDPRAANQIEGSGYKIGLGEAFTQMANVPPAPQLLNEDSWYNKLKLIVNDGGNPSDAEFLVAVSPDNFTTTYYLQTNGTLGATEVWRTDTDWGGASGFMLVALAGNTTYSVKLKARHGDFTESPYGPVTSTATSPASLSFDIDTAATDTETSPPYTVNFGTLSAGAVTTASTKIWVDISTNAYNGATVYVSGTNAGLKASNNIHTISAVDDNLATATEGYGLRVASVTQSSGGPLAGESPFAGAGDIVGAPNTTIRPLLASTAAPIESGRGSVEVKTRISTITKAAPDYTETLTLIAAGTF